MKRFLLILIIFSLTVFGGCGNSSKKTKNDEQTNNTISSNTKTSYENTIIIGYFKFEPYSIENPNNPEAPTGAAVDYWEKYIAPEIGMTIVWKGALPVLRLLNDLEKGDLDAILFMGKTLERASKFLYPEKEYIIIPQNLILRKDDPLNEVTKIDDLFGKSIGTVAGGIVPPFFQNDQVIIEFASGEDYKTINLNKLLAKRIDAITDDKDSILYMASKAGILDQLKVIPLPIEPNKSYTIFSKTEKGEELLKLYEPVNADLMKKDVFSKLILNYL